MIQRAAIWLKNIFGNAPVILADYFVWVQSVGPLNQKVDAEFGRAGNTIYNLKTERGQENLKTLQTRNETLKVFHSSVFNLGTLS